VTKKQWPNNNNHHHHNHMSERTSEPLEVQFLFQRISVLIQRFNSVLFHETFPWERYRHVTIPACF